MTQLRRTGGGQAVRRAVRQVHVVVRVLGRQRDSVRVCEHVVVRASGQAAEVAHESRDEIRLG